MTRQNKMTAGEEKDFFALKYVCKTYGCKLEIDTTGETARLTVTAPQGHWFANEQLHEFVDSTNLPWRNDFADVLARLRASPPEPHNDPECEWCNDD